MTHMSDSVFLLDGDDVFEIPADDVELEADGSGFWLLAADGEDEEEFYEFCDVEIELEDELSELPPSKQV